jgi:hypothetical protein
MTPAALEANRRNAKKAGRPKGGMNADKLELNARCRVNDERHIKILERIAHFSPIMRVINSRRLGIYLIEAMVDHAKQSRAAGQVALYRLWWSYRLPCATMMTGAVLVYRRIRHHEQEVLAISLL